MDNAKLTEIKVTLCNTLQCDTEYAELINFFIDKAYNLGCIDALKKHIDAQNRVLNAFNGN